MKAYQYIAVQIPDRSHLDDVDFLKALNELGTPRGNVPCPWCKQMGHAVANGFKRSEEAPKGATMLVVLMESEVVFECDSRSQRTGL
jgi:hypothetical protein